MLERLCGLETEYAIRYTQVAGDRPTNARIFRAYAEAVATLVTTRRGRRDTELFTANGGVIHYEAPPYAEPDGLVEGGTPECRGPNEVLLYQRAQDALLVRARPIATASLERAGHKGELGLLKNCRDAAGNIYGAQENYEVEIGRGGWLFAWRAGLVALAPLLAATTLVVCIVFVLLLAACLGPVFIGAIINTAAKPGPWLTRPVRWLGRILGRGLYFLELAIWTVAFAPFLLLFRLVAFRRVRRALTGFLISRPVFTGAGTLVDDRLHLSEKAVALRGKARIGLTAERVIFDAGNLCKQLSRLSTLDLRGYVRLFRRRQRMQLGLSDSNMAQVAEYLKVATTCLVIDLAESGALDDLPQVRRPVRALHALVADPTLTTKVALTDGSMRTALELQRLYLERLRTALAAAPAIDMEVTAIAGSWERVLDQLAHAPETLVGQLDWITKQRLLAAGTTPAARKKIDLKYHELEHGYFAAFERANLTRELVGSDEIERAWNEPPSTTPARARARLIRSLGATERVRVGWDRIKIGKPLGGRVIKLDDPDP